MDELHRLARELCAEAGERRAREAREDEDMHVVAVRDAQDTLLARLLDGLGERVKAAASGGETQLDLLAFDGNDTFDGWFHTLYLVKGPREREPGVEPLLPRLREALAPFKLHHVWRRGTAHNRLVVSWA